MSTSIRQGIVFDVETSRILEILSREIYDSPYAMLRENIQNAYDAILMRKAATSDDFTSGRIIVEADARQLVIKDNGIGMTEEVLRNNFWKAGSSGKRTELARRSGVIGTFGIGAMANFGVCDRLQVETRHIDSDVTLISSAERRSLSISRECIALKAVADNREPGTTIIADLAPDAEAVPTQAKAYVEPYIRFVPFPIEINGEVLSQHSFDRILPSEPQKRLAARKVTAGVFGFDIEVFIDSNARVLARLSKVTVDGKEMNGGATLAQGQGQLMAYRNFFGLAPAPVSGYYLLGGFANFSFLQPTAGREALSRESIDQLQQLVVAAEREISEVVSATDMADTNTAFQQYVASTRRYELAQRVTIEVLPTGERVPLGDVAQVCEGRRVHYYTGRDPQILRTFASGETCLLHVSPGNPRRQLQLGFITAKLDIEHVADSPTIIKTYSGTELSFEEAALLVRISNILVEDYFLSDHEVQWADISHGVPILVQKNGETVRIFLGRDTASVRPVIESYRSAYDVFGGFVRDFVRVQLYPHISSYVPSATREGAEALRRALQRSRELYRYEDTDLGSLEPLLADYLAGEIELGEMLKSARRTIRPQAQSVAAAQVGRIEQVLPGVIDSPVADSESDLNVDGGYEPRPPIIRTEVRSEMKLLTVREKYAQLNGFQNFLALSERAFKREGEFFRLPHTTKLIWGGHRVIYIFSHASGLLTLYYDIEFKQPLPNNAAGGATYPTTTIVTKDRIFIPVPDQLSLAFQPIEGYKEFFVRFDTLSG